MTAALDLSPIPLAKPALGREEIQALGDVLTSGRLVLGPRVLEFEKLLTHACDRKHCVAVSSGTTALELVLRSLPLSPDDEVIVPSFGFPAAANIVRLLGHRLVLADVDMDSWNLTVATLEPCLSPRTKVIISIDQFGLPAESAELSKLAQACGATLIDDAACSLGGRDSQGVLGGGYGAMSTLSFHPRKILTTGEGGAVLTDNDQLAQCLRELRNHGQKSAGQFARIGTNARMSELAAALGCVQLGKLEDFLAERALLVQGYISRLSHLFASEKLYRQKPIAGAQHPYQTFAVGIKAPHERARVISHLQERGIECGAATYATHLIGSYETSEQDRTRLPNSARLAHESLALPLYIGMRSHELDRVAHALGECLQ